MKTAFLSFCCIAVLLLAVEAAFPLNEDECVEWHNKYRKEHQAPDIKWSNSLANDAQKWADYLGKNDKFEHDKSRNNQGENLYWHSGDVKNACQHATTAFYNEVKDYDYDKPGFALATGHFTQVVWVKSTQLGVGKAQTAKGATILVFRYSPPGNYAGQFDENVKPPSTPTHGPSGPTTPSSALRHRTSFMHVLAFILLSVLMQALL